MSTLLLLLYFSQRRKILRTNLQAFADRVTGAIIKAVLKKARLTIENKEVETLLDYTDGLDPYYGLLELAEKFELVKKISNKYEFMNGEKAFESAILKDPKKYFTDDVLKAIDAKCKDEFLYGKSNVTNSKESVE